MKNENIPVITIDGPSGSGKGTTSQRLAQRLGWHFLDSGVIYRVLAYAVIQQHLKPEAIERITDLAHNLELKFIFDEKTLDAQIILAGEDITVPIRDEATSKMASLISAFSEVRTALLERQRAFQTPPGLVADGRDMGTIVFPDADLKVFLDANVEERAKRRYNQLKGRGINVSLEQVLNELLERDKRDKNRAVAPLKPASDAVIIDTTHLTISEVIDRIWSAKERRHL